MGDCLGEVQTGKKPVHIFIVLLPLNPLSVNVVLGHNSKLHLVHYHIVI